MEYGLFTMPSHPPERRLYNGHQWDLQTLRWADELGFSEAWIGEHHTAPWEPHPAPDLLVAQALMQTSRMRIGPGGFLMPYPPPGELANRVAMLDHLAQGRLNFGVAASGLPSDWAMFNVDGMSGQHREMTRESLEIILRLCDDGVYTSPVIPDGKAVLLSTGDQNFDIAVAEDLTLQYLGERDQDFPFRVYECLVLRIKRPSAIVTFRFGHSSRICVTFGKMRWCI